MATEQEREEGNTVEKKRTIWVETVRQNITEMQKSGAVEKSKRESKTKKKKKLSGIKMAGF